MLDTLMQHSEVSGFMPHGYCFLWTPSLLWSYVVADSIIAASYYSIPLALWYFARKRPDLPFRWVFVMFGVFVMACGTTHLFSIWNIWHPDYWVDAALKLFTAASSLVTAAVLWPLIPRALSIPGQRQLERANEELQREVVRRARAEAELQRLNASELRAAQQALEDESRRFRALMESTIDGIHIVRDGRLVDANPAFLRMLGYSREEALGLRVRDWDAQLSREELRATVRERNAQQLGQVIETRHRRKDGSLLDVEVSISSFEIAGQIHSYGIARDVSRRRSAQQRIAYLTRLYATLSHANKAMVRAADEQDLFAELCRVTVQHGGMLGAIARIVDEEARMFRPVAFSESMRAIADQIPFSADRSLPEAQTLSGKAYAEDRIVIDNDFVPDVIPVAWQTVANQAGMRSLAGLPMRRRGKPIGVFVISASEPNFFDAEMGALLDELVVDIAFTLDGFEARRLQASAEQALAESELKFRCLVEQSLTGISIVEGARFTYVNPRFAEIHGYRPEEMIGLHILDTVADEDRALVQSNIEKRLRGEVLRFAYSFNARRKDGSTVRVGVNIAPATMKGKPITVSMVQDISEREQAQRRIEAYIRQLEGATLGTVAAVSSMVEMRDPHTAGHHRRAALLAREIGVEMGLTRQACAGLEHIGAIHDLGKIAVPAEILNKPSALSEIEYRIVKTHSQAGHDVLKDLALPWPAATAILQHHERLDGSGYPGGLKGDEILIEARILAVADVVEAMASHRPYRPALGVGAALDEIARYSGTRYDTAVVEACMRLFREKGFRLGE